MAVRRFLNYPFLTGYERDGETALDFAQARYYANVQGRFTTIDPSRTSAMTVNPQSWNRYSYTNNLPTSAIDPDGLRTYYIGGFRNANPPVYKDKGFLPAVGKRFGEQVNIFSWSGKLKDKKTAAVALRDFIAADLAKNPLAPGERINVVAFSHGNSVVKHYTNLSGASPIDTYIAIASPQRPDFRLNRMMVDVYINTYNPHDRVQRHAGPWYTLSLAGREDEMASYNIAVTPEDEEGGYDKYLHHAGLHTERAFERIFEVIEEQHRFKQYINRIRNGENPWNLIFEGARGGKEWFLR